MKIKVPCDNCKKEFIFDEEIHEEDTVYCPECARLIDFEI